MFHILSLYCSVNCVLNKHINERMLQFVAHMTSTLKCFLLCVWIFYSCLSYSYPTCSMCVCSRYSGRESPCILLNVPDGHAKEMPTTGSKHKPAAVKEASPASQKKPLSAKEVPVHWLLSVCLSLFALFRFLFIPSNYCISADLQQVAANWTRPLPCLLLVWCSFCKSSSLSWVLSVHIFVCASSSCDMTVHYTCRQPFTSHSSYTSDRVRLLCLLHRVLVTHQTMSGCCVYCTVLALVRLLLVLYS